MLFLICILTVFGICRWQSLDEPVVEFNVGGDGLVNGDGEVSIGFGLNIENLVLSVGKGGEVDESVGGEIEVGNGEGVLAGRENDGTSGSVGGRG